LGGCSKHNPRFAKESRGIPNADSVVAEMFGYGGFGGNATRIAGGDAESETGRSGQVNLTENGMGRVYKWRGVSVKQITRDF